MPRLSVVVASHDRPLRLRWLLDALEAQTLDRSLWEVVVCHDSVGRQTDELLASHPLTAGGSLRFTRFQAGCAPPGANRNGALALALGHTVVFTDDDCRPPEGWLAAVLAASTEHPAAIVQGPVAPDPDEQAMLRSPYPRTHSFTAVPTPWGECCNIAYPRALLQELGGFVEDVYTGEDTELYRRARAAGVEALGDHRMLSHHAVEEGLLWGRICDAGRWGDLALLLRRHPGLRSELSVRVFWKPEHGLLLAAVAGVLLAGRGRWWLGLGLPWALRHADHRGGLRGRARQLLQLPGWALIDAAEIAVLARASVRHRTLIL